MADLAPPSPPLVTRLAQGPLDTETGELKDPLDADREADPPGDDALASDGPASMQPVGAVSTGVVSAQP